jgi:hypothetical protein
MLIMLEQMVYDRSYARKDTFTIEIIEGIINYHECPSEGYIKFGRLTMPDGTLRNYKSLYSS